MMARPAAAAGPGAAADWPALAFAMAFPAVGTWLYFIQATGSEWINTVYALAKIIQFAFPAAWLLLGRGLGAGEILDSLVSAPLRRRAGRGLAAGLASGALMAAIITAAYVLALRGSPSGEAAARQLAARLEEIGAATPLRFLALALFLSVVHSFLEEYYWRWFVFDGLRERAGVAPALWLSSLAFTAHHVLVLWYYLATGPGAVLIWPFTAGVAAGGAVWAWQYHRHGSILAPWVSHVLADLAIMAAGYEMALA